jgi:hypothetical protein
MTWRPDKMMYFRRPRTVLFWKGESRTKDMAADVSRKA